MRSLIEKCLSMPLVAKLLLVGNIGSLLFALLLQHAFDIPPCILCLWQRIPYAAVAVLSVIILLWKPYGRQTIVLLGLCAFIYLGGAGIAMFHTGVERHWWKSIESCDSTEIKGGSIEELRQALLATNDVPCDEIPWEIFGLSLANLNVLGSLGLAFFVGMAAFRRARPL